MDEDRNEVGDVGEESETGQVTAGPECSRSCPRHALLEPILAGVGWLAAVVAAMSVAIIPYDFGESLCGVWGCFPSIPALAAMHLIWGVMLGAAIWGVRRWRPTALWPVGLVLFFGAGAALAIVIGRDLPAWLDMVGTESSRHWPRRVGYKLATMTDVPLVQSLVAGVVCVVLGRRPRGIRGVGAGEGLGREGCIGVDRTTGEES